MLSQKGVVRFAPLEFCMASVKTEISQRYESRKRDSSCAVACACSIEHIAGKNQGGFCKQKAQGQTNEKSAAHVSTNYLLT